MAELPTESSVRLKKARRDRVREPLATRDPPRQRAIKADLDELYNIRLALEAVEHREEIERLERDKQLLQASVERLEQRGSAETPRKKQQIHQERHLRELPRPDAERCSQQLKPPETRIWKSRVKRSQRCSIKHCEASPKPALH